MCTWQRVIKLDYVPIRAQSPSMEQGHGGNGAKEFDLQLTPLLLGARRKSSHDGGVEIFRNGSF